MADSSRGLTTGEHDRNVAAAHGGPDTAMAGRGCSLSTRWVAARRLSARWLPLLLAAVLMATSCTSATTVDPVAATRLSSSPEPSPVLTAVTATIAAINETAGGPVGKQRLTLERLAASTEAQAQRDCPEATATLEFAPAWRNLRRDPTVSAEDSAANGVAYLLPTLIKIYDGSRITGTDMTSLHLWIVDGQAHISALCVA